LPRYDQEQRQALAPAMTAKDITLCEDENFHGSQPCLVAIEPLSNFLVLETYRPHRDADTWNEAIQTAVADLPVRVIQVTSDLAKGLQTHAKEGLGAQHTPNLMHVQADLHKATSLPLHRHLETARQTLAEVQETVQDLVERYRLHQAGIRSPGRAPNFEQQIGWAKQAETYWEQQVSRRQERQQQVAEAVRGLADDYHPFDAQSGQAVSAESMRQRLEQRVQTVELKWTPKTGPGSKMDLARVAALEWVGREPFWEFKDVQTQNPTQRPFQGQGRSGRPQRGTYRATDRRPVPDPPQPRLQMAQATPRWRQLPVRGPSDAA